jgi:predicted CXXCH cytochrome family protein
MTGSAQALTIVGSSHDLSGDGLGTTELCVFCHTPHESTAANDAPLWNRSNSTATSYTRYTSTTSSTYQATNLAWYPSTSTDLSSLCMPCHDGTVAPGTGVINEPNGTTVTGGTLSANAVLGTDLSSAHPVRMTFNAALVAAGQELVLPTGPEVNLFGDSVECASCHDVHDNANGAFLVMDNAQSLLCRECHTK